MLLALALVAPLPGAAELDPEEHEIRSRVEARRDEMVSLLERWAGMNTGTWNRPGLEAFAALLAPALTELGFEVESESRSSRIRVAGA